MLRIAIDGACRRNGKPDCVAAGGVFIQQYEGSFMKQTAVLSAYEKGSTNQRGELLALMKALDYVYSAKQDAQIITDSEYLFNAMTKDWYSRWSDNGWKTATGEDVKNADIWREIARLANAIYTEVSYYHIKGHCISFGKVTADKLLTLDPTAMLMYSAAAKKYEETKLQREAELNNAQKLSVKNNGFELTLDILKDFVVSNTTVDAIATKVVEAADREI